MGLTKTKSARHSLNKTKREQNKKTSREKGLQGVVLRKVETNNQQLFQYEIHSMIIPKTYSYSVILGVFLHYF